MKRSKKCNAVILAVLLAKTRGYGGRRGRSSVPFLAPDLGGQYFLALSFWLSFSSPPLSIWRPSSLAHFPAPSSFSPSFRPIWPQQDIITFHRRFFSYRGVGVGGDWRPGLPPPQGRSGSRKEEEKAKGWRVRSRGYETKTMTIIKLGYILATGLSHQGLTF